MSTREIVIIGGGIIGCTTAYYLSRHPSSSSAKITLIEASEHGPAQGASGKAGGLVARWAYPKEIVDVSFEEHVKLAEEHNGKDRWGWRYVGCGSWEGRGETAVNLSKEEERTSNANKSLEKELGLPGGQKPLRGGKSRKKNSLPEDLDWVHEELTDSYSPMARDGHTAQVHPYLFTTSMYELAKQNGVTCIRGKVTSILQDNGSVTGVEYICPTTHNTERISATQVLLAAGAWSPSIVSELPIQATRAHSITIRPKEGVTISPYVLFTEITEPPTRAHSSPEIYARPDNEVYACGPGDDCPLPDTVDEVVVDQTSCDLIYRHVSSISKQLREGVVEKKQACYLPSVSTGGGPMIGEAKQIAKGLFIGTGHTCWWAGFVDPAAQQAILCQ
ncbi:Putative oxidoreductase TDA3 [Psilocybe cubensis]|uniref:Oxidoreductase TDA3 n=1 Tax=Psilocybe cubensis TaxID=181762 RepID=A0ACB8GH31_PSICU|nr:Putative oxidoreductase TDA3 [Psilocybe cubensis]KAH9474707.1 Putative oxidoreductase TDA3 [Psilocybe cubensis]